MSSTRSKPPEAPKVLFHAEGVADRRVKEWLSIVRLLRDRGYASVFVMDERCTGAWVEMCVQAGARCLIGRREVFGPADVCQEAPVQRARKAPSPIKRWIERIPLAGRAGVWLAGCIRLRRSLRRHLDFAKGLIAQERPRAIVLYTDAFIPRAAAIVKAANRAGIPTLICPLAGSGLARSSANTRKASPEFDRLHSLKPLANRFMGRLFPDWVVDFYGVRMLFHPIQYNIVAALLGVLPRVPYSRAGGYATRVTATCELDRRVLLEQGISDSKIVTTGRASFDSLHQSMQDATKFRDRIYRDLGLDVHQKMVLFCVPQRALSRSDQTAGTGNNRWPWDMYCREVEFILETFMRFEGVQVVMTFHPGVSIEDNMPLAKKYGAVISTAYSTAELAPLCDIFVSEPSSTLELATGAGKPALLLYHYDWSDRRFRTEEYDRAMGAYYAAPAFTVIWKSEDLLPAVERLLTDEAFYARAAAAQRRLAPEWIMLDGKCTERVTDEIVSLVQDGRVRQGPA